MPRSARDQPKQKPQKPNPQVVDQRPLDKRLPRSKERGNAEVPIRTILYVECGDMANDQVQFVCQQLQSLYAENEHPHYVIPMRRSKINSDIVFEEEFLRVVKKTCKVDENGEIVLIDDAKEVDVIRKKIY